MKNVNSALSVMFIKVDFLLDKGVIVDAWVRISLVGIELLTIEAKIVIASVETYLKYSEAFGLTTLAAATGKTAA